MNFVKTNVRKLEVNQVIEISSNGHDTEVARIIEIAVIENKYESNEVKQTFDSIKEAYKAYNVRGLNALEEDGFDLAVEVESVEEIGFRWEMYAFEG